MLESFAMEGWEPLKSPGGLCLEEKRHKFLLEMKKERKTGE